MTDELARVKAIGKWTPGPWEVIHHYERDTHSEWWILRRRLGSGVEVFATATGDIRRFRSEAEALTSAGVE